MHGLRIESSLKSMIDPFCLALLLAAPPLEPAPELPDRPAYLEAPFRVTAGGAPIVPYAGHGKPFVTDWDGDGVQDLLVGQFGDGRLRIHLNGAEKNGDWELNESSWFYAEGELGKIPSG